MHEQQQILINVTSLKEERLINSVGQSKSHRGKGKTAKRQSKGVKQQKTPVVGIRRHRYFQHMKVPMPATCALPNMRSAIQSERPFQLTVLL